MQTEFKQVIIVRRDLKMRKGKIASQVAHASMKNTFYSMNKFSFDYDRWFQFSLEKEIKIYLFCMFMRIAYKIVGINPSFLGQDTIYYYFKEDSNVGEWLSGIFTKIVLGVDTEQELFNIQEKVNNYNRINSFEKGDNDYIACEIIKDAGLTVFNGIPTNTCLGIGPGRSFIIDGFTENLSLL